MKRLLGFAFILALLGSATPAFAQQYDRHGYYRHDRGYYVNRYRYVRWQPAPYGYYQPAPYGYYQPTPYRYRYWHERPVTYYNNAWGYWGYRSGLRVFISIPL
jgi:hypothetical protein